MKHSFKNNIICPYCDHENTNTWEIGMQDEDLEIIECGSCEKKFEARCTFTVEYCSVGSCKENGELPHTLVEINGWLDLNSKEYQCKKCFEEYYDWELHGGKHPKIKENEYIILEAAK